MSIGINVTRRRVDNQWKEVNPIRSEASRSRLNWKGGDPNQIIIFQIRDFYIIGFDFGLFFNQYANTKFNGSTYFYNNRSFGPPFKSDC
jgi:hypothetical protein